MTVSVFWSVGDHRMPRLFQTLAMIIPLRMTFQYLSPVETMTLICWLFFRPSDEPRSVTATPGLPYSSPPLQAVAIAIGRVRGRGQRLPLATMLVLAMKKCKRKRCMGVAEEGLFEYCLST